MLMVGQDILRTHLIKLVNQGRFPRCLILVGDKGYGKRTLVEWLAETTMWDLYRVSGLGVDDVRAVIEDSLTLTSERIYLFADAHDMTTQAQNALLKIAEEPPPYAYIILTTISWNDILPTIRSRAVTQFMSEYTLGERLKFTDDELLASIVGSPGMIKRIQQDPDAKKLVEFAEYILDNIGKVTVANTFNILKHVKPEHYDLLIVFLLYQLSVRLKLAPDRVTCRREAKAVGILYRYKNQLRGRGVVPERVLEQMFVDLREVYAE